MVDIASQAVVALPATAVALPSHTMANIGRILHHRCRISAEMDDCVTKSIWVEALVAALLEVRVRDGA